MEKVLTIVVPSYNVEKYLEQTLNSFVEETVLREIEVLIVDDGSKDTTAEIGKKYEDKYPETFRVISKENGGHGSTINKGIEEGCGKYFKVVDGDDWVNTPDFVKLVQALKTCDADYVVTNYYEVHDGTGKKTPQTYRELKQDGSWPFCEVAGRTQIGMHPLVIKTSILQEHHIRLDEHCFYVDVEYVLFPVPYVESVAYFDLFVYMYRLAQATQSVSMQGYQKHMQNHIDVIFHLVDFLQSYQKQQEERCKVRYISKRIAQMIGDQITIFMSFPDGDRDIKTQFMEFDRKLKSKSKLLYQLSGEESGMLRLLRKTKFIGYRIILRCGRIRNGMKG